MIWTIGHSTHTPEHFISLLQRSGIEYVIDVRSAPQSKFAPQFDRSLLQETLIAGNIRYAFFGEALGGRPAEPALYDEDGRVRYGAVAKLDRFQNAIARLVNGSSGHRIAIMCAEEDPGSCHRRLLVGRVLTQHGILLQHLRGDGRVEEEQAVALLTPGPLIGAIPDEERDWKSIRSVLRRRRPKNSSSVSARQGHAH